MNITFRIWLPVAIIFVLMFAFGGSVYLVLDRQAHYREQEDGLNAIVRYSNRLMSELKDAETGQRGFLLTGQDRYLEPFVDAEKQIPITMQSLHISADKDVLLGDRVSRLDAAVSSKMSELRETVALRRDKGMAAATAVVVTDRGLNFMVDARALVAQITDLEHTVLETTIAKQNSLEHSLKLLLLIAGPCILLLAIFGIRLATRRIVRSVRVLEQGVAAMGVGGQPLHIDIVGHDEFGRLAGSFNSMAARLGAAAFAQSRAETQLRDRNTELADYTHKLEERTQSLDVLSRISHRLPGCTTEGEFSTLIERYIPQLFVDIPGALYLLNPSRTLLRRVAQWNSPHATELEFQPDACWAMRRGQVHINLDFKQEMICSHMNANETDAYMCWPLMAQNDTVGLLYFEHVFDAPFVLQTRKQDIGVLCETIALALVNMRLRDTLRSQSIRDPLTGLFNRRYLEESLDLEFSRAERSQGAIAIIMMDIDHFKRFNDTFGHAAGDVVLKHVGEVLGGSIRKGDLACRYGGEEFVLVLVGASAEAASWRAEQVRNAVKDLRLEYNGSALGTVTVSLGVATYGDCGTIPIDVINAADKALYQAKHNGRDQVCESSLIKRPPPLLEQSA